VFTNDYCRPHVYLPTNNTLIHNSLYVRDILGGGGWEEEFKPHTNVVQLQ
jgi:hypothetical protein